MIASNHPINILVLEDRLEDFILFKDLLSRTQIPVQNIFHEFYLEKGLDRLKNESIDVVFLDLSLPDSFGIEAIEAINKISNQISIVVLSGSTDIQLALQTIVYGAQDYLIKDDFDIKLLEKTIRYSIERKKILATVVENLDRYNSILKLTSDTIWDWNLRTNEFVWNEGISNVFLYNTSDMDFHFDWFIERIHRKDRTRVLQLIAQTQEQQKTNWEDEFSFLNAKGEALLVYARGYILMNDKEPYRMLCIMMDITERRKMQQEILNHQLKTQQLVTKTVIETQEIERKKLGLELHDNINQILATTKLWLDIVLHEEQHDDTYLRKSFNNINKAIEEIRRMSKSLVPPSLGDIGLKEALLELFATVQHHPNLTIRFGFPDKGLKRLSDSKKLAIFRIVQEQLHNILKHSKATEASFQIEKKKDHIELVIYDNGIGFDSSQKRQGIGLANINSRVQMVNGHFHLETSPDNGCLLKIDIPLG